MPSFQEYVQAWIERKAPPPPIVELLGVRLLVSHEGTGVAELAVDERHHNAMGAVHGGVFCDLGDVAIGAAIVSILAPGETFATIGLNIDFLRPVTKARVTARASVLKRGSRVVFCHCRIQDDTGHDVADVRSSVLVFVPSAASDASTHVAGPKR